jgi:hypothetical protein
VDELFRGSSEFLIAGVLCLAGGVLVLMWLSLYRRYATGRSLVDEHGVIDLRCPECQYRMVGLKEARCPECGREYTLDELVGRQNFEVLRAGRLVADQPSGPINPPVPDSALRPPA